MLILKKKKKKAKPDCNSSHPENVAYFILKTYNL